MLSPSEYILQHMDNIMRPILDVGDQVKYDRPTHKNTVPSREAFEKLLNQLYRFKIVSGEMVTESNIVYEITAVKNG